VPVTDDGEITDDKRPTPLRVFECNFCGLVALFSEDHKSDTESGGQATELMGKAPDSQTERVLMEQRRVRQQTEATKAQHEQIIREQQRLQQLLKR
jgi:membrane protein involved in colicin uptake